MLVLHYYVGSTMQVTIVIKKYHACMTGLTNDHYRQSTL